MKNIKVMKKEYVVIEKKELEGLLIDLSIFAAMVNRSACEAKLNNIDYVTGIQLDQIAAMSDSTVDYIADIRAELI